MKAASFIRQRSSRPAGTLELALNTAWSAALGQVVGRADRCWETWQREGKRNGNLVLLHFLPLAGDCWFLGTGWC